MEEEVFHLRSSGQELKCNRPQLSAVDEAISFPELLGTLPWPVSIQLLIQMPSQPNHLEKPTSFTLKHIQFKPGPAQSTAKQKNLQKGVAASHGEAEA